MRTSSRHSLLGLILQEKFGITAEKRPQTESLEMATETMTCRSCGGSGIQRINDKRFRTCLDCLGQGEPIKSQNQKLGMPLPTLELQHSSARFEPVNAVVSSSVAK